MKPIILAFLLALSVPAYADDVPEVCYEDGANGGFYVYPKDCYDEQCAIWCPPK